MKRFFLLTACLFCFALVSNAQVDVQATDNTEVAPQDGPTMVFEDTTVDYGTIEQGSDPYRFFAFTNTGNEPLVIKHAKGSCGCTVPTYPKEPIPPGETGEIKVRYDTNRVGPFTKRVTLTTNVGDEPIQLTIKGKVEKKPEAPASVPASEGGMFGGDGN